MGGALVVTNMILLMLLFQVRHVGDVNGMHPISLISTAPKGFLVYPFRTPTHPAEFLSPFGMT